MADTKPITFFVSGVPRPGGSKDYKGPDRHGRARLVDSSGAAGMSWRENVAATARSKYMGPLLEGPLEMGLRFWMPRPKAHYSSKGILRPGVPIFHTNTPDATKLTRSAEDALKGIIWKDDCQIVIQSAMKLYTNSKNSGVFIMIAKADTHGDYLATMQSHITGAHR